VLTAGLRGIDRVLEVVLELVAQCLLDAGVKFELRVHFTLMPLRKVQTGVFGLQRPLARAHARVLHVPAFHLAAVALLERVQVLEVGFVLALLLLKLVEFAVDLHEDHIQVLRVFIFQLVFVVLDRLLHSVRLEGAHLVLRAAFSVRLERGHVGFVLLMHGVGRSVVDLGHHTRLLELHFFTLVFDIDAVRLYEVVCGNSAGLGRLQFVESVVQLARRLLGLLLLRI